VTSGPLYVGVEGAALVSNFLLNLGQSSQANRGLSMITPWDTIYMVPQATTSGDYGISGKAY